VNERSLRSGRKQKYEWISDKKSPKIRKKKKKKESTVAQCFGGGVDR